MAKEKKRSRVEAHNRKGKYSFKLLKTYTAGIQICGSEVKSIKVYAFAFADAYCVFKGNELFLRGFSITPVMGSEHEAVKDRKLLLKRQELTKISNSLGKGLTIVPMRLFENERGRIKLDIGLVRGNNEYDKRNTIKERDLNRQTKTEIQ